LTATAAAVAINDYTKAYVDIVAAASCDAISATGGCC
jgi:hypothetical protein